MEERETLMNKQPETLFEKLIWERYMNKALSQSLSDQQVKYGQLQSEMDELKDKHKKEMDELIKSLRRTQQGQLVVSKRVLKTQVDNLLIKNKTLKRQNDEVMRLLIQKNKDISLSDRSKE